ncbi:MAG: hypothetical protein A2156_07020 [Deltaproteobacteria bacterium RBG_16_48_10]|nr:MAG: hypothetical protein A2156_07020 [Deltaproteobacteria bacterium RBG_16_48_10]
MVITQQVKDTVDHQEDDHLPFLQTETIRLTPSRVRGDDHIAQKLRVKGRELALPHGKGKDIGGFVTTEISTIQFLNLAVVDKGDAEFGILKDEAGQDRFSYFF